MLYVFFFLKKICIDLEEFQKHTIIWPNLTRWAELQFRWNDMYGQNIFLWYGILLVFNIMLTFYGFLLTPADTSFLLSLCQFLKGLP